jgi:uncharacterized protein (DUF427 family)
MRPLRIAPKPGQESVWDYPRPPRAERTDRLVEVVFGGRVIVSTRRAVRVLETSHPPTWYLPPEDIAPGALVASPRRSSFCEWKGRAVYWTVRVGDREARDAAWSYPSPTETFALLRDHVAFYAGRMDACRVDGVEVVPQPGGFYGGWITPELVGPFKGTPGTEGW